MSSLFRLDVTVSENANGATSHIRPARKSPAEILDSIARYFDRMAGGMMGSSTHIVMNAVQASGSLVLSGFTTGDTITIGATTLTGAAGAPANENEFNASGSDSADTTALVACINAHSVLSKYVSAAKTATATCTITSLVPGVIGNAIILSASAHATPTAFASGSEDTPVTLPHGA